MLDIILVISLIFGYILLVAFMKWCDYEIQNN